MSHYKFVNPYNFVPLASGKETAAIPKEQDAYSGVIEYSVLTKTPLFIPNTSTDEEKRRAKEHCFYDFFTYTNLSDQEGPAKNAMPVIPGSEIRGMFRSYFEILTNSCMYAVDYGETLSKRTAEQFKAGLIKRKVNEDGSISYDLLQAGDRSFPTEKAKSPKVEIPLKNGFEHQGEKRYDSDVFLEGEQIFYQTYVPKDPEEKKNSKNKKPVVTIISKEENDECHKKGYILKGEAGPQMIGSEDETRNHGNRQRNSGKHCCHIFYDNSGNDQASNHKYPDISLDTLDKALDEYAKNGKKKEEEGEEEKKVVKVPYQEYREQLTKFKRGETEAPFFPVYYSYIEELNYLMLSPACITREINHTTMEELIGPYKTCTDANNLCPACSLFGAVGEGKNQFARASRIRFSDLACEEDSPADCFDDPITLPPLLSPKINNMEFYMRRPDGALFWTYDYFIDERGNIKKNTAGINGRKFYWHNMEPEISGEEKSKLNFTIRPVKKDVTFTGKLYFKNISKKELDRLIFLLNCGESDSGIGVKTHGYKLGGAKPLGLGSIAVSVDKVSLRKVVLDNEKQTVNVRDKEYECADLRNLFDPQIQDDFEKMTDFYALKEFGGYDITYPRTEKNGDIFEWFSENHVTAKDGKYLVRAMPRNRKQMAYERYMEPLNPMLRSTRPKNR